jgi:hypothetical protein
MTVEDEDRYRLDHITIMVKIMSCMNSDTMIKEILKINEGDGKKELVEICILQRRLNETIQELGRVIDFHVNIRTAEDREKMGVILNILQAIERIDTDFGEGRCCLTRDQVWTLMDYADEWYSITSENDTNIFFRRVIIRNALLFKEMIKCVVGIDNKDDSFIVKRHLIACIQRCKQKHTDTVDPYGAVLAYINQILPSMKARVETRMDPNVSNAELNDLIEDALDSFE